ncbi:MAG: hypothetical protein E5W59_31545, partial [Mesorhizobium sp.]
MELGEQPHDADTRMVESLIQALEFIAADCSVGKRLYNSLPLTIVGTAPLIGPLSGPANNNPILLGY